MLSCSKCGTKMSPARWCRSPKKFCSGACRTAAYRARHPGTEDDLFQRREAIRRYYKRHPEKKAEVQLKLTYGITFAQYTALLKAQGGVCAICHQRETAKRYGKIIRLSVDHDHHTGKIRELLCAACNSALNKKFTPARLRAMADYLERHLERSGS